MNDNLGGIGNIIKGIAALIALFPGLAVIFGLVEIPPTVEDLVKLISFSVSLIVLIGVFLLRKRIRRLSDERAALIAGIAVVLGAVCLTFYFQFGGQHTVRIGTGEEAEVHIIPLNPSQAIRDRVAPFADDYEEALRMSPQSETLKDLMEDERFWTVVVIVLLLVFSQVLLIAPVVAAAWKLAGTPEVAPKKPKKPATPQ